MRRAIALHDSHGDWKIESTRSGAGRIEVADPVDHLVVRKVTVTEDDEIRRRFRERRPNRGARLAGAWKDVREKKPQPSDREPNNLQTVRVVIVAANEADRRDLLERGDDVLSADVPGVHDGIDTAESFDRFGPDQSFFICDDANSMLAASGARRPLLAHPQIDAFFAQVVSE